MISLRRYLIIREIKKKNNNNNIKREYASLLHGSTTS